MKQKQKVQMKKQSRLISTLIIVFSFINSNLFSQNNDFVIFINNNLLEKPKIVYIQEIDSTYHLTNRLNVDTLFFSINLVDIPISEVELMSCCETQETTWGGVQDLIKLDDKIGKEKVDSIANVYKTIHEKVKRFINNYSRKKYGGMKFTINDNKITFFNNIVFCPNCRYKYIKNSKEYYTNIYFIKDVKRNSQKVSHSTKKLMLKIGYLLSQVDFDRFEDSEDMPTSPSSAEAVKNKE